MQSSRRFSAALRGAIAVIALAGCGSSGTSTAPHTSASPQTGTTTTTTTMSFTAEANAACVVLNRMIESLPDDTTALGYAYDTPRLIQGDEALAASFATFTPPASSRAAFGKLRQEKARLIALLIRQYDTARSGSGSLTTIDRAYESTARSYNQTADTLGLNTCAAAATPRSSAQPPA